MIELQPDENIIPILAAKVFPLVEHLSVRKWADEDIANDLQFVRDALRFYILI